jgi:spore coat protein CotH
MDFDEASDMKDVFQKLMKNPTKLMGLVKTVGDKLDSKIKTGDLKESELIAEATEMMNKMKNMPGMDNIQSMLSKMGMGNLSGLGNLAGLGGLGGLGGGKVNMGAMQANLDQKMKLAKTKERILAKSQANAKAKAEAELLAQKRAAMPQQPQQPQMSEEELLKLFATEEKIEKTPRGSKPQPNKKKGKK